MSFMDKLKSGLDKAQHEINEFAETTKVKMEVSKLQSRKKDLFTQIGQQVYELHVKGQATPAESTCTEIDGIEREIAQKNEQIAKLAAAPAAPPDAGKPA
ncbi:MAG TPA: hypothetical protein VLT86_12125 [Vicinamibacterales bacterium]|nr:hypothetical protein [Vicinamibacterales bacterium]